MAIPYDPSGGGGSPYTGPGGKKTIDDIIADALGGGGSSSGGSSDGSWTWAYVTKPDGSKWQVPRLNQPPFTEDWDAALMLNPPKATSGGSSGGSSGGGGSSYSGGGGGSVAAPYDINKDWNLVKAGDGQYYWVNMYTQEVVPASGLPGEMPVDEPTVPKTFTNDGTVVGINPITGEVVWDYEFPEDPAAKEYKYTTINGAIYYYDPANPSAGYNKLNPAAGGLYGGSGAIGGSSKPAFSANTPNYITPYSNSMVGNQKTWDAANYAQGGGGGSYGTNLASTAAKQALELQFLKSKNAANLDYQSALQGLKSNQPMSAYEKAQLELAYQRMGLDQWQAQQAVAQEEKRRRLEAVGQLQSAISTTDPAAFAAMMAAYGGNIENALAGGGTALSPAAMLPAAALFAELGGMGGTGGTGGIPGTGSIPTGGGTGAGGGGTGATPYGSTTYMGRSGPVQIPNTAPPATEGGGGTAPTSGGGTAGYFNESGQWVSTDPRKGGVTRDSMLQKAMAQIQQIIDRESSRPGKAGYDPDELLKTRIANEINRMSKYNPELSMVYQWMQQQDTENPTITTEVLNNYLDAMVAGSGYDKEFGSWVNQQKAQASNANAQGWAQAYQQALAEGKTTAPNWLAYQDEYYKAIDEYNKMVESYNQPINSTLDYASQQALGDIPVYSINGQMWTDYGKYQGIWNPQQTAIAPSGQYSGGQYGDTSQTWQFDNPFAHPSVLPQNQGQPTPVSALPPGDWALNTVVDAPFTTTSPTFSQQGPGQFTPIDVGTTLDIGTPYWVQGMWTGGKAPKQPYMVGEIGPELIIPGKNGDEVIPLYNVPGFAFGTDDPRKTMFNTTSTTPTTTSTPTTTTARDATVPYVPPTTTNTTTPTTTKTTDGYRPTTGTTGGSTTGGTSTPTNTTPTSYNQSPVPTDVATSWANMGIFGNNIDIPEWLQPFLGQVQDIREGVQYPSLNPYAVDFGLTDPTIMQMWALGRQAQYGIPVASTMFEAQRQALPGIGSTYSVRY